MRRLSSSIKRPLSTGTSEAASEAWRKNLSGHDEARLVGKRDEKWWFTGTTPEHTPGFDGKALRSLAQPRMDQVTKQSALAYFQNGWGLYETLFSALQGEEAFYRPPQHGLRHPMQFYYGHTAVFYINKSVVAGLLDKAIEPAFESQFEVGVDEMRWDDMTLGSKSWPKVSLVTEYRREVYKTMVDLIDRNLDSTPKKITWDHPLWSLFMACEHDRIHVETSSVLIRELPLNLVRRPEFFPENFSYSTKGAEKHFPMNELVPVKGKQVVLGKQDRQYPSYGWDNEYGKREVPVADFHASKDLVTNGEFLEFVKAGGYRERRFWSEDGWGWRRFRNAQHPFFWVRNGPAGSHKYLLRQLFEVTDFALALPAVVNYHESKAFCTWKAEQSNLPGLRLITEAEHQLLLDPEHRAATVQPSSDPALLAGGDSIDLKFSRNTALAYSSERPVDLRPENSQGFRDAMGNVWQWTEDQMAPYPGFEAHPYYGDFTEPCFDGKHQVIKGGSFASTADNGSNAHCRFHFRPHFLQHSGVRYVLPSKPEARAGEAGGAKVLGDEGTNTHADQVQQEQKKQSQSDYESKRMVAQYISLHFGAGNKDIVDANFIVHDDRPDHALDFPRRCAILLAEVETKYGKSSKSGGKRALDLGCAVGGSSFNLAALGYEQVLGMDLSAAFVQTAEAMKSAGKLSYEFEEDERRRPITVSLSKREEETRQRTSFRVGDACKLPLKEIGSFDAVLAANLLCRLPDPHACLNQMPELVKPGGVVLFVSPFSWMSSFTEKNRWLGPVGGSEKELVAEMKSLGFELVRETNVPLFIRDHRRKYQYIVSHAAAFRNDN